MDDASRGAAAIAARDFPTAISYYTKALIQHPTSPDFWAQRSVAFTRLPPPLGPDYTSALHDAEAAVLCGQKRAKREKIQAGQQRRVVALFGLEQYADAKLVLDSMTRYRSVEKKPDKMEGDMWQAKVDRKLANLEEGDERRQVAVKEFPEWELPDTEDLVATLKSSLDANGKYKFDNEDAEMMETGTSKDSDDRPGTGNRTEIVSSGPNASTESIPETAIKVERSASISHSPAPTTSSRPSAPLAAAPSKIRHEWFQSHDKVTVTVYAKGVPKDKADIDISDDSLSISFAHPAQPTSTFSLTFDPLYAAIDASSSSYRVLSTKVEVVLAKKVPGQKWPALEGTETPLNEAEPHIPAPSVSEPTAMPSYPTSSKSGPKNWDKVASDLSSKKSKDKKGEDDEDSDFEGADPVDGFFKKLYAGADEDTRRAMMKSYYESQGTSLSTNWDEVGKGKVEPVPPKDD